MTIEKRLLSWVLDYRYWAICMFVIGVMIVQTRNRQWVGDFWEHSAVVRELATNISHPKHPQLLLETPHAFYSPYSMAVAVLSRVMNTDAVTALAIMGILNLVLFLIAFRFFVASIFPDNVPATASYALILTLFCWGPQAWRYSGFYNMRFLSNVIPLPSTFCVALAFTALGINHRRIVEGNKTWLIALFLIALIVVISHPLTFLVIAAGLIAQSVTINCHRFQQLGMTLALLILALAVAAFWPYYPFMDLAMGGANVYHESNRVMYSPRAVLLTVWPTLIAILPVIVLRKGRFQSTIAVFGILLFAIYAYGAITGKYSYGRVISSIVLLAHLTIADSFTRLESVAFSKFNPQKALRFIVVAVVIAISLSMVSPSVRSALSRMVTPLRPTSDAYEFLNHATGQYDVILTDINSGWITTTYGGKVIATAHPVAFVPDHDTRKADVRRFFSADTDLRERNRIVDKYVAKYLLLSKKNKDEVPSIYSQYAHGDHVVFENDKFYLISLAPM